jgi:hypothetical protein
MQVVHDLLHFGCPTAGVRIESHQLAACLQVWVQFGNFIFKTLTAFAKSCKASTTTWAAIGHAKLAHAMVALQYAPSIQ